MPRRALVRQNEFPYHVYNRTRNKEWYQLSMPTMWHIGMTSLAAAQKKYKVKVHAFVLMQNHYHLLISTTENNIDMFMAKFSKMFSDKVRYHSNRINQIFGGRYKWSIVENQNYYKNILRYVFANPVRAGLSTTCESYSFSTLLLSKYKEMQISPLCDYRSALFSSYINSVKSDLELDLIKNGLRNGVFKIAQDKNTKKPYQI
jgi:putative transposase